MVGIVKDAIAPIFSEPNQNSELIDEALHGWKVKIIHKASQNNDFCYIETDYGYNGYIRHSHLNFFRDIVNSYNIPINIVISNFADILDSANLKAKILATIHKGSYICVIQSFGEYTQVLTASNIIGYIKSNCIKKIEKDLFCDKKYGTNPKNIRINIVNAAKGYLKTPYRWGGKTHLGIDCSGLSFMSYFLSGTKIYRDAKVMPDFPVKKIAISEIKPADLIFFCGHVAIFIGDGAFIHSSSYNNGVDINFFGDNYFNIMRSKLLYGGSVFKQNLI